MSHPSVGAGVSQHSDFKRDPWGRLLRTLDYTSSMLYGGPDLAREVGRRVREMHRRIEGVRPDGVPYHALDPAPWAWVHATLAESIVRGYELFCSQALEPAETEGFWSEWRRMGRLVGVRYEDRRLSGIPGHPPSLPLGRHMHEWMSNGRYPDAAPRSGIVGPTHRSRPHRS